MDALARYGGIYLDTDFDVLRPFDRFRECQAFLGFQIGDEVPTDLVAGGLWGRARPLAADVDPRLLQPTPRWPGRPQLVHRPRPRDADAAAAGPRRLLRRTDRGGRCTAAAEALLLPLLVQERCSEDVTPPDVRRAPMGGYLEGRHPTASRRLRRTVLDGLARRTPGLALMLSRSVAWCGTQRPLAGAVRRRLSARSGCRRRDDASSLRLLFDADYYRTQASDLDGDPLLLSLARAGPPGWTRTRCSRLASISTTTPTSQSPASAHSSTTSVPAAPRTDNRIHCSTRASTATVRSLSIRRRTR